MSRLVYAWFALFALAATGCASDGKPESTTLDRWTLRSAAGAQSIVLPTHVDVPPGEPYTLTTTATIPPELRGTRLTLSIDDLPARARLRASGEEAIALDHDGPLHHAGPQRFAIAPRQTAAERLDLELTVEHTWVASAWLDNAPRLSSAPEGDAWVRLVRGINQASGALALITLAVVGASYLLVFALDRQRRAYGWFGAEAITAITFPLFEMGLLQYAMGSLEIPVLALCMSASAVASLHFVHAKFDLGPAPRAGVVALLAQGALACFTSGPFTALKWLALPTIATIAAAAGYQVVLFVRLRKRTPRPPNLGMLTLGWPLAVVLSALDCVHLLGQGDHLRGLRLASLGISAVAVFQSAAMSLELLFSYDRTDALNVELAGRVAMLETHRREVEVLYEELKRQIAMRSEELADALAKAANASSGSALLAPGDVVAGRYQVIAALGAGASGRVYKAKRIVDGRTFALKLMSRLGGETPSDSEASDRKAPARFVREAHIAAEITHTNVVNVVDVDVTTDGHLFLVIEYVDGPTLRSERARFGDASWALPILRQIAEGLAAIHARGIVHRDLKRGIL